MYYDLLVCHCIMQGFFWGGGGGGGGGQLVNPGCHGSWLTLYDCKACY